MYLKLIRKSPLNGFKLDDFNHDYRELKKDLDAIEGESILIDQILLDPEAYGIFTIDDTTPNKDRGYSSQKIEQMLQDFRYNYLR